MYADIETNVWKYYLYKVFTSLQITVSIYVIFLLANSFSMTLVMFLQSFYTFFIFLFEIPSGLFADKYGKKISLVLSSVFLTVAFIIFWIGNFYFVFFVAAFFWALAQSLRSGADSAFLFDSLKESKKENLFVRHFGRSSSLEMLVFSLSAIIGGVLASYFGNRILFLISALMFFISFLISLSFIEPKTSKKLIEKKHLEHLKTAIHFSYNNSVVRYFLVFFSIFGAFAYMLYYLIQPFFNQGIYPKLLIGIVVSGYFLFSSIGSFFSEYVLKAFKPKTMVGLVLFTSFSVFLLIPILNIWASILLVFIHSFVAGIAGVLTNTEINKRTSSENRATVLSLLNFFQKFIYAFLAPFIGYLADVYTLKASFFVAGVIILLLFVVWYINQLFN